MGPYLSNQTQWSNVTTIAAGGSANLASAPGAKLAVRVLALEFTSDQAGGTLTLQSDSANLTIPYSLEVAGDTAFVPPGGYAPYGLCDGASNKTLVGVAGAAGNITVRVLTVTIPTP